MKKVLVIVACGLVVASIFIGTQQYKEQTGQDCGPQSETTERVHWVWQWLPHRDDNKSFIDCVGPSYFIVYRPLDIAAVGVLISAGLLFFATKRR